MATNFEIVTSYRLAYNVEEDIIDETTGENFDRTAYSLMKYGDRSVTMRFAEALATDLTEQMPALITDERTPELLVAYKQVPPACYFLSRYCLDILNVARLQLGHEPGRLVHIYKNKVAATDYAMATQVQRETELDGIDFSLEGRQMADKNVLLLDDIRITGSAEKKMLDVLQATKPNLLGLGYIAIFNPDQASLSPSVENDLNAAIVSGVNDLIPMIEGDNFDLNIRTLKLILNTEPAALAAFLKQIPKGLVELIHRSSVDTGVEFIAKYNLGYSTVRSILKYGKLI